jgi:hypothetical protein
MKVRQLNIPKAIEFNRHADDIKNHAKQADNNL